MSLKPQPVILDPTRLCGDVTHDNYDVSKKEWVVLAAKAQSGVYLDKSRWDFNESERQGATRDATLSLARDATDQIELLRCGEQITLYITYNSGNPGKPIDSLAVRMRA
jgi:hypothetical protein